MLAVATKLSVEEFLALDDDNFRDFHELHAGEIVEIALPSKEHIVAQRIIEQRMTEVCGPAGFEVIREFFFVLPEEARRADVAMLEAAWAREQPKETFQGAPPLVMEILSPSNKHMDLDHLREVCFCHGTREFWIVNMEFRTVLVYRPHRKVVLYGPGDSIPLDSFGIQTALAVDTLFALEERS